MKLITEHCDSIEYLVEEKNNKRCAMIEGIFMQAEAKNRNGRVYSKPILEKAVDRYVTEQVATGRAVGELNHPDSPSINLDKVSHRITELRWDGNNVIGKASILETPMGKIVKGLMEGGVRLGVSSRGMGSLEERNGATYVKEDFTLATIDIVQDPSAHEAFVNGIMEGVEWVWDNGLLKAQRIEEEKKKIVKARGKNVAEAQIRAFKNLLFSK